MPELLSVVIPNWNGARFLAVCLDALRRQTYPHLEVIVADNASTDASRELVRRDYPGVRLIEFPENLGFTGACNAGIRAARGEYIALLNNDTEVDPRWAGAIVRAFEAHPEVGSVASKMLLFDRRDHLHTAGDLYGIYGWATNRGIFEKDEGQFDAEAYVFSACGGSAAYRRGMLDEIGLLDDDFFFCMEDIDLGWRAQLWGWRCLYVPHAIVYHHLSATGGGTFASYYGSRNAVWVIVKNYPWPLLRRYYKWIYWRYRMVLIKGLTGTPNDRAKLRGVLAGLVRAPFIFHKRAGIQRARRVTLAYLDSILDR